jgi:hypothetical protein
MDEEEMLTTATIAAGMSLEDTRIKPRRSVYSRMIENYSLVWLNSNIDSEKNTDVKDGISKFKEVVSNVQTFTNIDECISFMNNLEQEQTFMIVSGALEQSTGLIIHNISQIIRIYILDGNQSWHKDRFEKWLKISGVCKDIDSIIKTLQLSIYECEENFISISFIPTISENSHQKLDQLDCSFIYTQIIK